MTASYKIQLTSKGVFQIEVKSGKSHRVRVAEPIRLRATGIRKSDGVTMVQIRFRNRRGETKTEFFPGSDTLPTMRIEIQKRLANAGYDWPEDQKLSRAILQAVITSRPKRQFTLVPAPGWYENEYVIAGAKFARSGCQSERFLDASSNIHLPPFVLGEGSLADWQTEVAKPSRKSSRLRLGIAAALAAPFIRLLGLDSFGINLFGKTSDGKSLVLFVAASISGVIDNGTLPSWGDSEAAMESQSVGHRDNVLPRDEVADGERNMPLRKAVQIAAFMLSRNRTRSLARQSNGLAQHEFRNILLSSSERAFGEIANSAGDARLGGEEVRIVDVPATELGASGIFDGKIVPLPGKTTRETTHVMVEAIKRAAIKYQGHVIRALLSRFVADPNGLETLKRYKADFEASVTLPGDHNAYLRVRTDFAVLYAAAALAIDYGLLPWKKEQTLRAIAKCMRLAFGAMTTVKGQAKSSPEASPRFFAKRLNRCLEEATLVKVIPKRSISLQEAKRRQHADGFIIREELFIKSGRFKKWLPNQSDRFALRKTSVLRTERQDTITVDRKIAGISGKPRYYIVKKAGLERVINRGRSPC